ncbi:hypothetical protein GGS26DRAFT_592904 [Hypomontagnella submonticulosa]|nr:hypothetical protein GGS26DRAFT_592904 [Hypomontagnella submonticulosa]
MKNIVHILVWEWAGMWLGIAMIINTLFFNGFATGATTEDSWLRLGLILVFGIAVVLHVVFVDRYMRQVLSCLMFQATWLYLMKWFTFGEAIGYDRWIENYQKDPKDPLFRFGRSTDKMTFHTFEGMLIGETKLKRMVEDIFEVEDRQVKAIDTLTLTFSSEIREMSANDPKLIYDKLRYKDFQSGKPFYKEVRDAESAFQKQINPIFDNEVKIFEKAAESSLEQALTNATIMLGICLVTGLASFTSISSGATTAQLGSYALLLSVITGLRSLMNGASHLNTLAHSARALLRLQEHMLSASWDRHLHGAPDGTQHKRPRFELYRKVGYGYLNGHEVNLRLLWQGMDSEQRWRSIMFGPAASFLPTAPTRMSTTTKLQVQFNNTTIVLGDEMFDPPETSAPHRYNI